MGHLIPSPHIGGGLEPAKGRGLFLLLLFSQVPTLSIRHRFGRPILPIGGYNTLHLEDFARPLESCSRRSHPHHLISMPGTMEREAHSMTVW